MNIDSLSPVWTHLTQIQPARAEGVYIYDKEGKRYLDFTSGIGVTNTGHCHPRVVKTIQKQAAKFIFGQINIVIPTETAALSEKLKEITPQSIDTFFFSNSGAEAVEASIKLARHATQRRNIIVFQGSFHGRTAQTMAMTTSKYIYRKNYQPLPPGVFVAPFPYSYRFGWDDEQTTQYCLQQLDLLLHSQTSPEETAAVIIEPILGEGGYVPAPGEFLQKLRNLCTNDGILLIVDEVQSGFGRTGKLFGFEHAEVVPDIIVMAKGIGSGVPISGIGASHRLMDTWESGTHGGTYGGGSAIASAAAFTTIEVLQDENLVDNAAQMGVKLSKRLRQLQIKYPIIGDVRGRGLMVATEFVNSDNNPDKEKTKAIQNACIEGNLFLLTCGTYENVIRWIPPLIVKEKQIEEALSIFETALKSISN